MSGLFDALNPHSDDPIEKRSVRSGITLATITNIKDPKNLGRVKCAYITSDQDAGETGWIHCLTLLGGDRYGTFFHPNAGDVVALAYENGDIHRPFVIGSLWVGDPKPPLTVRDGKNEEYQFITPNKSYVDFSDTEGKEKITVSTPKNRQVILDDGEQEIHITDGKNSVRISGKTGAIEIKCDKKLTVKVGGGVTIECDGTAGTLSIKTNKEITMSTAQLGAKASGTAEVSGNGSVTVKSSGMLTLKGSVTKIN